MPSKVHQNIILDGKDMGDTGYRVGNPFYNEGKWNNFIKPLLPDGDVFIEYGSNVGMYLNLASKKYTRVIGLERDNNDCRVAERYLKQNKGHYKTLNVDVNKYDISDLPLADVSLLANFHYHQHIDEFRRLLDKLESKTCYVLIVSVEEEMRHWRAQPHIEDIKRYFDNWIFIDQVKEKSGKGIIHPRRTFSLLFKSTKAMRVPLKKIKIIGSRESDNYIYGREFVRDSLNGIDYKKTEYYLTQNDRRDHKWSQPRVDAFIKGKRVL